jgi:hypothetical protein
MLLSWPPLRLAGKELLEELYKSNQCQRGVLTRRPDGDNSPLEAGSKKPITKTSGHEGPEVPHGEGISIDMFTNMGV